jgi:hypothetical protein
MKINERVIKKFVCGISWKRKAPDEYSQNKLHRNACRNKISSALLPDITEKISSRNDSKYLLIS